jgi:aminopeptidase N
MSPSLRLLVGAGVGVAAIVYLLHRSRTKQAPKKQLKEIRRLDYRPSAFSITEVDLVVRLDDPELSQALGQGTVTAIETVLEMTAPSSGSEDLVLNAEELHVVEVAVSASPKLSGWTLLEADKDFVYDAEAETLTVARKRLGSGSFALRTVVTVKPETNLELQGLYKSSGIFCTQMEAEGYRRMAPHLDRPDVLCTYRVRIEADKAACPVLLSNGNRVGEGPLPGGRHYATYFDPFPKPSYLVALVAGNLGCLKGGFQTMSGKTVEICIYTEPEFVDQLGFAMQSIQKAMEWDEVQFGREYDLDVFNIVAVADFNMGAMENKSLNVFNSKCVLALPTSATDATMRRVEGIIAHEYFHNWTGNRVTCRDWFQLTLKEGLTVYRDTRFTSDTSDPTVKRIGDVKTMRQMQFPEDAGPMAHPIRPEAYVKMDNFYTRTVCALLPMPIPLTLLPPPIHPLTYQLPPPPPFPRPKGGGGHPPVRDARRPRGLSQGVRPLLRTPRRAGGDL